MATSVNKHLVIHSEEGVADIQIYLNAKGEIFVTEVGDNPYATFFTFNKQDWAIIKEFIDEQFED